MERQGLEQMERMEISQAPSPSNTCLNKVKIPPMLPSCGKTSCLRARGFHLLFQHFPLLCIFNPSLSHQFCPPSWLTHTCLPYAQNDTFPSPHLCSDMELVWGSTTSSSFLFWSNPPPSHSLEVMRNRSTLSLHVPLPGFDLILNMS